MNHDLQLLNTGSRPDYSWGSDVIMENISRHGDMIDLFVRQRRGSESKQTLSLDGVTMIHWKLIVLNYLILF